MRDIATIQEGTTPQWISVNANGQDAVLLQVFQQSDGNSVRIAKEVQQKLSDYRPQLPPGITLNNWYDQSQLVTASADSVRNAILIGVILAAAVILFFLRNIKITLIALLVVPASLAITCLLISMLGMSFNIMTLGGMAAAIGLVIDDAIVMIEQMMTRLRAHPEHHQQILLAAFDFFKPLIGSSAATTVIFIPLAFLEGVTGAFFKALSFTMASALIISFFVSWLVIPLLADHFLNDKDAHQKEDNPLSHFCHRYYTHIMQRLLQKPYWICAGLVPLILIGVVAYTQVGSGFMPTMDEGGFNIDYKTPPGTALSETNRLLKQVEKIIKNNPDIESYSRRTGVKFGGADPYSEANEGDIIVKLKRHHHQDTETIMEDVRHAIEQNVPGLEIEIGQLMEDAIGDLTAVPQPIEIKVFFDDENVLMQLADKINSALQKMQGVVDIRNGINPAGDALMIQVDRSKVALEGADPAMVATTLNNALTGIIATQIQQENKIIGVRTWVPSYMRNSTQALLNLVMRAPDGHLFPLSQVAKLSTVTGQPQLTRENLKSMVAITARINGRDMGSTIKEIKQQLNQPNYLPKGAYYELGGLYQQQQMAFHALLVVLISAFALVFLLLLFLYEQFRIAIAIVCLPILAMAAVLTGLWITHSELNIAAIMGMTMIVGIITEVAIFYFSEYQTLLNQMDPVQALTQAGLNRMRPIIMTTMTTILALLPLALGLGQGATMEQPLAISIISGLVIQLPLVLLVMPMMYYFLMKIGGIKRIPS